MKDNNPLIITILLMFILGMFAGGISGYCIASDFWKQQVVDKGFAEWNIVTGSRQTEFKWKEK